MVQDLNGSQIDVEGNRLDIDDRRGEIGDCDRCMSCAEIDGGTIVHPAFLDDRWNTLDGVQHIADELNLAAEAALAYGMKVAFHNHDLEVRTQLESRSALVRLMDLVEPTVGVEFDPLWAVVGGGDPAGLGSALGARILAVHLKDGPLDGGNADQLPMGEGEIDWEQVLEGLPPGIPWVIAPDWIAADPLSALRSGLEWAILRA